MPAYQVRNNTRGDLPVTTRTGFYNLRSGEVKTLDLIHVNSERMRALQQGGRLTIVPAVDPRTGRTSRALPRLHLGMANRYPALPAQSPTLSTVPTSVVTTPATKQLSVAFTAAVGSSSTQARISGPGNTNFGAWATATSPQVFPGLTTGQVYSVQLRGVNGAGPGPSVTTNGTPT